ncbi:MAG TPA: 50S ribosomal protein L29 [Myxococcota bacterium]|nr:50S ribosomal protein L29 [Myxococcota bacterium]HRY94435.1 50S ribosomal protein L29 [Myxococcota bacterium]
MKATEYRERTLEELNLMLRDLQQDIFNLRFQHATGQLDNISRLRMARRDLARLKTVIREHEIGIRAVVSKKEAGAAG